MELWRRLDFLVTRNRHKEAIELWKSESSDSDKDENYYWSKILVSKSLVANGEKELAKSSLHSGLKFLETNPSVLFESKIYSMLGTIAHIEMVYDESLINFQKVYNLVALDPSLEKEKANALNNIGSIQMLLKDYDGAEANISKAIELLEFMGDFESAARSYGNLASNYQQLSEYDKSLACLERGLSILTNKGREELVAELIMLEVLGLFHSNHKEKATERFHAIPIDREHFSHSHSKERYDELKQMLGLT